MSWIIYWNLYIFSIFIFLILFTFGVGLMKILLHYMVLVLCRVGIFQLINCSRKSIRNSFLLSGVVSVGGVSLLGSCVEDSKCQDRYISFKPRLMSFYKRGLARTIWLTWSKDVSLVEDTNSLLLILSKHWDKHLNSNCKALWGAFCVKGAL